jgi:phosphatidate cytidylyltransferase
MFIARLATAVVLLAGFVAGLFFLPHLWWTALLLPALFAASWEWTALAGFNRPLRWAFAGIVLVSAILTGYAGRGVIPQLLPAGGAPIYAAGLAFWILVAVPWLARGWCVKSPVVMGIAGWFVLVPAWLALAQLQSEPEKLLALLGIVWISDTAAYGAGRAWGTHKLAPGISPGKTWEGIAGAAAAVAVYYVALSFATPDWGWWNGIGGAILFAGVALAGVLGDLFESWIKRQAGVKDSGMLLPGHGGVLDRIDSMTSSLPLAALLLSYAS